jgi:hypothetical protein
VLKIHTLELGKSPDSSPENANIFANIFANVTDVYQRSPMSQILQIKELRMASSNLDQNAGSTLAGRILSASAAGRGDVRSSICSLPHTQ